MFTKPFNQISKSDAAIAGGKGASLGEMTQAGIPVPPGFVILADAFEKFLEDTDLNVEIDAALKQVKHNEVHTVENASEKIHAMILAAKMPKDLQQEIQKYFKKLGAKYVAVRSSATSEDSASAAWAGQLDSFLNTTSKTLLENVKKCWASLFTPRAIFYRFEILLHQGFGGQEGLHNTKISVAVVVQKMVESEKSGIAFSVHPVTQDENQLIIEAGFGLGEAIVSGTITPDSYVVGKRDLNIIDVNVNEQTKALYRKNSARLRSDKMSELQRSEGGNQWQDLGIQGKKQVLKEKEILELAKLVIKIENHYGFPCDIEWAREKNKFYIVQSRPITTLSLKAGVDKKFEHKWVKLLTRKNSVFMDSMKLYASTNIFNDLGYDYRLKTYKIVNGDNYVAENYSSLVDSLKVYVAAHPQFLREVIKKAYFDIEDYKKIWRGIEKIEVKSITDAKLLEIFQGYVQSLYALMAYLYLPLSAETILTAEIQSLLRSKLKNEREISNVFQKIAIPVRRSLMREEQIDFLALIKRAQAQRIDNVEKAQRVSLFNEHLSKWAWLGDHLFWGTFWTTEDLNSRFNEYINKNCDEEIKRIVELEEKQKSESDNVCQQLNLSKSDIEIICLAQEYVYFRTYRLDMLFLSEFLVKNVFGEIASRLKISFEDLVLLAPWEIVDSLREGTGMSDIIQSRKESYSILVEDYVLSIYSGEDVEKFKEYMAIDSKPVQGTVAYPGNGRGKVNVIFSKVYFNKFQEGDILVTHMTTPDFVPLMRKCEAIITDEGGITCHAAIISRELKKPCIIGTKNATQVLHDGDLVEVDAEKGVVRILEKAGDDNLVIKGKQEKYPIFQKAYSRELPLFLATIGGEGDLVGLRQYLGQGVKNILFVKKSKSTVTSVWYDREELDQLDKLIADKITNDSKFFPSVKEKFIKYWQPLEPYSNKKEIKTLAEFEKFYKNLQAWWPLMALMFWIPAMEKATVNDKVAQEAIKLRERTEKFSDRCENIFITFFNKKYPQYKKFVSVVTPTEVLTLKRRKFYPRDLNIFEDRLKNGFAFLSGEMHPLSKIDELQFPKEVTTGDTIKGQIAFRGKVSGQVVILHMVREINKVKKGNIIVAPMTTPAYLPAMKKATAFVTDEGGVTCHAAIVAREMKKPCIIGTKNATQVLKDGDLVEVDAEKGVVKILKKAGTRDKLQEARTKQKPKKSKILSSKS